MDEIHEFEAISLLPSPAEMTGIQVSQASCKAAIFTNLPSRPKKLIHSSVLREGLCCREQVHLVLSRWELAAQGESAAMFLVRSCCRP